jgi:Uma2 family endonuclease
MATLPMHDYNEPAITVEEYLTTSYRPDCDYVNGRIEERNLGEFDHGYLQLLLGVIFTNHRDAWGVRAVTDVRTQVSPARFRVPDISVLRADAPREPMITHPPLIVIEILSPEDRLSRFQDRIGDYLEFGIENVWIIDPERRSAWTASSAGLRLVRDGELSVEGTPIQVMLQGGFAEMDRA